MTQLWQQDDGLTDVTSAFTGITTPIREVIEDIHRRGWTVNKIHIKDGSYVAEGKSLHGEKVEATGRTDATAAANLLVKIMRKEHMRSGALKQKLGAWDHQPIEKELSAIAQAYAGAPVYEPKAASAWMELAQDCGRRAQIIRTQLSIEYTDDPVPYESADDMREDVTKKRHITLSRAYAHHPVWTEAQLLDYRLVVDVLGHTIGGADWGWHGTCMAFATLAPMFADSPQKALYTELLGQTAFGTFYRQWGPQKICFLEDLVTKAQEKENGPGHHGVHPSQSIIPTAMPGVFSHRMSGMTPAQEGQRWLANAPPDSDWTQVGSLPNGYSIRQHNTPLAVMGVGKTMSNCWQSGIETRINGRPAPNMALHDENAVPRVAFHLHNNDIHMPLGWRNAPVAPVYAQPLADWARSNGMTIRGGDPNYFVQDMQDMQQEMPHEAAAASPKDPNADWQSGVSPLPDNAYLWQRQDGVDPLDSQAVADSLRPLEPGLAQMHPEIGKQAVVNALRSSLLGSRNNAMGHAIHYQSLAHIPAGVDDPIAYWDTLEQQREHWNQARGYAPGSHKQYWPEEQKLKQWVKAANPHLDDGDVQRLSKREMLHMLTEEEEHVLAQDQGDQLSAEVVQHEAYEALKRRLGALTKPNLDQKVDFGEDHLFHEAASDEPPWCPECDNAELEENQGDGSWSCPECGYDKPLTSPTMYHMALQSDRESIARHGIDWRQGESIPRADEDEWPNGNYLYGTHPGYHPGPGWDMYAVDTQGLALQRDPADRQSMDDNPNNWYTTHPIPPHLLTRLDGPNERTSTHHADMYPPYLASRLRPIAQVSRHADELAEAAREDLTMHRGHGHHFRAKALGLGIPQLGPRQVSNAWLHLAPQTSQLAVIDPHIMETLGHDYANDASKRDYFRHEREMAAGRDASGYGHVPLGPFSAGLFDLKTGGPGFHPDRTAFKAHPPAPHSTIDWNAQEPSYPAWDKPYWWDSTQQARDQAGKDFDRTVSVDHPTDEVPFRTSMVWNDQGEIEPTYQLKPGETAYTGQTPWLTHPGTGERVSGQPGTSLMQHVMTTMGHQDPREIWAQDYEVGKDAPAPGTIAKVAMTEDELRRREHDFNYGACGGMAMALHEHTGWPLVKVTDAESVYHDDLPMDSLESTERAQRIGQAGMGAGGLHWLVQRPDGKLVDASGARAPHEVFDQYEGDGAYGNGEVALGYTDLADARDEYLDAKGEPIPMDEIRQYVPAVLDRAAST